MSLRGDGVDPLQDKLRLLDRSIDRAELSRARPSLSPMLEAFVLLGLWLQRKVRTFDFRPSWESPLVGSGRGR